MSDDQGEIDRLKEIRAIAIITGKIVGVLSYVALFIAVIIAIYFVWKSRIYNELPRRFKVSLFGFTLYASCTSIFQVVVFVNNKQLETDYD